MKGHPIDLLVYEHMFSRPKQNDPQDFATFLHRYLIPEIRQETESYYGQIDTEEAKFPGLDYNHPTHRIRLSRWPWHRRLFRCFDSLRLTPFEISRLTKWEGTKWAKQKYEKERGSVIRDTTADGIPDWIEPESPPPTRSIPTPSLARCASADATHECIGDEDSEEEPESVGLELNQRLRLQAARREAGEVSAVLDEEWEQWLKAALESGQLASLTEDLTGQMLRHAATSGHFPADLIPSAMLDAARSGYWSEIPESLHPIVLHLLESESERLHQNSDDTARLRVSMASQSSRRPIIRTSSNMRETWARQRFSALGLPGRGSGSPGTRTAEAPGA